MTERRAFMVGLVVGLAARPLDARAQAAARTYRIGWLDYSSSGENVGIFVQAMRRLGWVEGKTFTMEYRGAEGRGDQLARMATELVRRPADVIVAPGAPEALAARGATRAIPIVMTGVEDPVESGLAESLARPGGNVTGVSNVGRELSEKLLSLLHELLPRASRVAVLWDATRADQQAILRHLEIAGRTLGLAISSVQVQRHTEVEAAVAATKKQGAQVLVVPWSLMLVPAWIADLAMKQRLPLASTFAGYAYEGGIMAYTDDSDAVFDRAAVFVDKILRGAQPADLPIERPTKFKLIVNKKTAQALGLTIPPSIMLRADHVIQ